VPLDEALFFAHLDARAAGSLEALHVEDLYLACACLHQVPTALERFDVEVLPRVDAVVRRYDSSDAFADEVRQALRHKLFMPPPRIAEYSGQGPLVSWLRSAAARTALNLLRPDRPKPQAELDALDALPFAAPDPELAILQGKHRGAFRAAFQAALADLPVRERTALKLNALDGLPLEKIGAMYGKDKSTISRWIARAQEALLDGTRARMSEQLALDSADAESLMRALKSQLVSSLVNLLKE
jgi:RNA polymerase sigma-70 factor (ECF subfamily)